MLPADAIEMYNLSKRGQREIAMVNVSDDAMEAGGAKFTLRSLGGAIAQAVGFTKTEEKPLESVKVAKQKRRGRLFDSVDLDKMTAMGSMQEVDTQLEAAKENGDV